MILPTGCSLHVQPSPSGKEWHAWCDCGWNKLVEKGQKGRRMHRFDLTQERAMAHAVWHARAGVREQAKLDIQAKVNGMRPRPSTKAVRPPA